MPGGYSGLFPGVIESRKKREEERQKQLKEYAKVAFTDAQEERIREIIREEKDASFERTMDAHRHVASKHKDNEA